MQSRVDTGKSDPGTLIAALCPDAWLTAGQATKMKPSTWVTMSRETGVAPSECVVLVV